MPVKSWEANTIRWDLYKPGFEYHPPYANNKPTA
jgi:hypothetical protein